MRESLIELLGQVKAFEASGIDCKVTDEYIADYLLANGVIVPPFKVGDNAYIIISYTHKKNLEFKVVEIVINKNNDVFLCSSHGEEFAAELCCATKEEAEQALKEGMQE